ncbi:MAG: hypothetical protein EON98_10135 [Chitinophagaceae bacterium]|nr:MAG: hypothetical protein EON98_10135 [Chitinophagaceae bacterium]
MLNIFEILSKWWKLILSLTLTATLLALIISLLRPKEYAATVTALPTNSAVADKARLYNNNIEGLYPELGNPDELDRVEGTAKLDTVYTSVAKDLNLASHYKVEEAAPDAGYKAGLSLKKKTDIRRSAYGELKIKVWDENAEIAAKLANAIFKKLNDIQQHIRNANNAQVLQKLQHSLEEKLAQLNTYEQLLSSYQRSSSSVGKESEAFNSMPDSVDTKLSFNQFSSRMTMLQNQVKDYEEIIGKYELAVNTTQDVLIPVEQARPSLSADKPKILQTVLFAFAASLLFSVLLAALAESRKTR